MLVIYEPMHVILRLANQILFFYDPVWIRDHLLASSDPLYVAWQRNHSRGYMIRKAGRALLSVSRWLGHMRL